MADKTDDLDWADLQEDFGSVAGLGAILARDDDGVLINPKLALLAYQSQGWTGAKVSADGKTIEPGKKEEGVEWDPGKISIEVQKTDWYKDNDGNRRLAADAKNTDLASWNTKVSNTKESLKRMATQRGADLSYMTEEKLDELADTILTNNYTYVAGSPDGAIPDSVLDRHLPPLIRMNESGDFRGQAQTNAATLRGFAEKYGVAMSDQWYANAIQGLDGNTTTLIDLQTEIVNNARETWPTLDGISLTKSTYDIADSYMQRMANVLEMDVDTINLETPEIKNALVSKDADGNPLRKNMWEFEQDLRMDPRWETTKQGQQELSDAGMRMLKEFGFYE